jgi:hypothetical protein
VRLHFLGDSFVVYGPIFNESQKLALANVFPMLSSIAYIALGFLSAGIPLRGGIEVGVGAEWSGGGIYGPILAEAHALESTVAQYPRVVIGSRLAGLLSHFAQMPDNGDELNKMNKAFALACQRLVCTDQDGTPILDYLGDVMRENLPSAVGGRFVRDAFKFVTHQLGEFAKQQNTKLAFRYTLLRDYFSSRIAKWGISP